ncbi:Arc family DNA-binding protein [Kluyvera intermedia]|uniref:Arc family DNA-binding protein n=1 Tax=Kluyvera intermedia TaxID=61648 RepID=UPI00370B3E59
MSKYPSQMQDKFNLRFPDGMRDAVAERAKRNGRSMNSEIIQIIEDALSEKAVKEVHINVADGDSIILDTRDIDTFVKGLQAFAAAVKSPKKNPT